MKSSAIKCQHALQTSEVSPSTPGALSLGSIFRVSNTSFFLGSSSNIPFSTLVIVLLVCLNNLFCASLTAGENLEFPSCKEYNLGRDFSISSKIWSSFWIQCCILSLTLKCSLVFVWFNCSKVKIQWLISPTQPFKSCKSLYGGGSLLFHIFETRFGVINYYSNFWSHASMIVVFIV